MLKKVSIACFIFGGLLIGASLLFSNNKDVDSGAKNNGGDKTSTNLPYDVYLVDSNSFDLRTVTYNNNLVTFIKSKKKYTTLSVEYDCYDKNNEIVQHISDFASNVDANDEVVYDFVVDVDKVKKIEVRVKDAIYDKSIPYFDKNKIKFVISDEYNDDGITVSIKSDNRFDTNLDFIHGYLCFYQNNGLVKTEPFKIENISIGQEISARVGLDGDIKYDNVKVLINTIF